MSQVYKKIKKIMVFSSLTYQIFLFFLYTYDIVVGMSHDIGTSKSPKYFPTVLRPILIFLEILSSNPLPPLRSSSFSILQIFFYQIKSMLLHPTNSPFKSSYLWAKTLHQIWCFSFFNLQHHFPKNNPHSGGNKPVRVKLCLNRSDLV